mgnify:CR=1 FL=1
MVVEVVVLYQVLVVYKDLQEDQVEVTLMILILLLLLLEMLTQLIQFKVLLVVEVLSLIHI